MNGVHRRGEFLTEVGCGTFVAALAEGMSPSAVGEALRLAGNQLVLRDCVRRPPEERSGKPVGSVHGDAIAVRACDSANAWWHLVALARITASEFARSAPGVAEAREPLGIA